ncbi:MAG: DNA polymerase III subunit chi [Rhizobiales bacterium]|nr:DNA polymerase III subunit chi [Hyphomicrobiales bacterium]
MAEVWFYHLESRPLERVLPMLLERTLARGWKAVVQAGSPERVAALDSHLWTYENSSFLPHGRSGEPNAGHQPILLTAEDGNENSSTVRFLVDGAWTGGLDCYERVIVIFDGGDADQLAAARTHWKEAKAAGHALSYHQETPDGRWEKKA